MNIQATSRGTYVSQLAYSIARETENEDASLEKLTSTTIDVASIQTEGPSGILGYLSSPDARWREQQQAVLRDIAAAVSQASGQDPAQFKFQMLGNTDRSCHIYQGRAIAEGPEGLQVYTVGLHDTPEAPGGLLVVAPPMSRVEMEEYRGLSEDTIRYRMEQGPWIGLGHLEQGWQVAR